MNHPDEEVQRAAADPNAGGLSPKQLAIEAAKRLAAVSSCNGPADSLRTARELYGEDSGGISRDYSTCLTYLISLPQPDPGPIDAEWLESIGGVYDGLRSWRVCLCDDSAVLVTPEAYKEEDGSDVALMHVEDRCDGNTVNIGDKTSRQHVLNIIAALKGGAE